jgi:hypothetical protein
MTYTTTVFAGMANLTYARMKNNAGTSGVFNQTESSTLFHQELTQQNRSDGLGLDGVSAIGAVGGVRPGHCPSPVGGGAQRQPLDVVARSHD